jgi:hypothetical protein
VGSVRECLVVSWRLTQVVFGGTCVTLLQDAIRWSPPVTGPGSNHPWPNRLARRMPRLDVRPALRSSVRSSAHSYKARHRQLVVTVNSVTTDSSHLERARLRTPGSGRAAEGQAPSPAEAPMVAHNWDTALARGPRSRLAVHEWPWIGHPFPPRECQAYSVAQRMSRRRRCGTSWSTVARDVLSLI